MITHAYSVKKEEEEFETDYDSDKAKYIRWYDRVLLNRPIKVLAALLLASIAGPVLMYVFIFQARIDKPPSDGLSIGTCNVPRKERRLCGIAGSTASECHSQCCYDHANNLCYHRLPSRFSYLTSGMEWSEDDILQPRIATVPYASQNSKTNLKLSIDEQSPTHLTLTFYDATHTSMKGRRNENKTYAYDVSTPELNIIVNSTQGVVFSTERGPLIASANIWEIAFRLTNETMYGLGELPLKSGTTKILYNRNGGLNSIPLIFARINDSYHGVLIDGSSPTEVSVHGNNHVVVRSITNDGLRFHVFVGPEPKHVMEDAMKVIGSKVKLEYWMLGAHLCSETAGSVSEGFEVLRNYLINTTRDRLPFESHCGSGPIVFNANQCDVEDIESIQKGIDLLKTNRKRFVPHVSPHIRHDRNLTKSEEVPENSRTDDSCYELITKYEKLLYRLPETSNIYQGTVGELKVVYPSYDYASEEFMKGLWVYNKDQVDGVIFENSWPLDQSNKTHNETKYYLPYFNQNFADAFQETPPWNLKLTDDGMRYLQRHNTYGNYFAKAIRNISGQDIPAWSSSQWMNGEVLVNKQNVDASWTNFHKELIEAALGGISGHWLWASPICGDTEQFDISNQASLCVKWYMAGTFFPIVKIHSRINRRDPLHFVGTHRNIIVGALTRRLSLLPYLYTILQKGPVLRPMFYQFPEAVDIADRNTQFSIGDALVIVPNLQPDQTRVHFWLPPGTWYELWSGLRLAGEVGQALTMSTTEADFFIAIRGGSILAMQKTTRETADETRLRSPLSLTIALECANNGIECVANGQLFVAENMSLIFEATEHKLTITPEGTDISLICDTSKAILINVINELLVYGLKEGVNNHDHHHYVPAFIDLCSLESINEFPFN